MNLHIVGLIAENFKRIKAVEINPKDHTVILSGANEQGKSSILDAIQVALCGKDSLKQTPTPIRKGAKTAKIVVNLGEYIVERTFTETDSYLTVKSPAGAKYPSAQKLLDSLFDKNTIDPSAFLRLDEDRQFNVLREIVGLDFTELEAEKKRIYEERTIVNRDVKALTAKAKIVNNVLPEKETPASDITAELQKANETLAKNNELRQELREIGQRYKTLEGDAQSYIDQIESLNLRLQDALDAMKMVEEQGKELRKKVDALQDPDIQAITDKLTTLETSNRAIRENNEAKKNNAELVLKENESTALSTQLEEIEAEKQRLLQEAKFPVPDLSFDESRILYKGLPFSQASQEERIRVSLGIAIAQNPKLRVILIRDASLLDKSNMKVVAKIAKENDCQIWLEKVDESGEVGFVIEDGAVKEVKG